MFIKMTESLAVFWWMVRQFYTEITTFLIKRKKTKQNKNVRCGECKHSALESEYSS